MATVPPSISLNSAGSVASSSAVISGTTTPDFGTGGGDISSPVTIYYGLTSNSTTYSTTAAISSYAFSASVTGLSTGTTYYAHAVGTNGNGSFTSNQITFTTTSPPVTRTNLITNPSFELDTASSGVTPSAWTDYVTSQNASYKGPSTDFAQYGSKSWKFVATGTTDAGIKYRLTGLTPGATLLVSGYLKISGVTGGYAHYVVYDTNDASGGDGQGSGIQGTGSSNRWLVTKTVPGTGEVTIFIGLGSFFGAVSAGTAWFDGIQAVQETGSNTRYIDGDQVSQYYLYNWNGTPQASTSSESTNYAPNFLPFF